MAAQRQSSLTEASKKMLAKPVLTSIVPPADQSLYTQFYCEENVWHLCDHVRQNKPSELCKCYVVFISNDSRCIPLWRQRIGQNEDKLVTWDYHVIFLYEPDDRCLVFDLDSDLPFPTYFPKYVTETIRTDRILDSVHHRFFRVLSAPLFLQKFASDRSHMKSPNGTFTETPPPFPPIRTAESINNINEFISMDQKKGWGIVYNLHDFVARFFRNQ